MNIRSLFPFAFIGSNDNTSSVGPAVGLPSNRNGVKDEKSNRQKRAMVLTDAK
jgi:hypothetical protein